MKNLVVMLGVTIGARPSVLKAWRGPVSAGRVAALSRSLLAVTVTTSFPAVPATGGPEKHRSGARRCSEERGFETGGPRASLTDAFGNHPPGVLILQDGCGTLAGTQCPDREIRFIEFCVNRHTHLERKSVVWGKRV